jgi:hypothetical protein
MQAVLEKRQVKAVERSTDILADEPATSVTRTRRAEPQTEPRTSYEEVQADRQLADTKLEQAFGAALFVDRVRADSASTISPCIQRAATIHADVREDPERIHEAGRLGIRGAGGPLPYLDQIQKAFGRHDVSSVVAHVDGSATAGALAMGAAAFTMGDHVAFAGTPSLRTVAHEAAHAIQQRVGVDLADGIGQVGDTYEQHADAVADLVVRGQSSEALLGAYPAETRTAGRGEVSHPLGLQRQTPPETEAAAWPPTAKPPRGPAEAATAAETAGREAGARAESPSGLADAKMAAETATTDAGTRGSPPRGPADGGTAAARTVTLSASTAAPASPWWPDGPTVDRKTKVTPLADYVAAIRKVESAFPDSAVAATRMRRLYYSKHSGPASTGGPARRNPSVAGPRFDQLIDSATTDAPLTSPPLDPTALNRLFETDAIVTPSGEQIDPAHFFAMLDLSFHGTSIRGWGVEVADGVELMGVLTWSGDLASWFVDWLEQKKKPANKSVADIALLLSRVNRKVSKEDLLSDMDAQLLVASHLKGSPLKLDKKASEILESYYGSSRASGTALASESPHYRFALFVKSAVPKIPHKVDPADPLKVELDVDAEKAIYKAVRNTAEAFLEGDNKFSRIGVPDELDDHDLVIQEIAKRFTVFLVAGLKTGDAAWP